MKEAAPRVAHDVAEDLIQLCAAGDRAAFAELYDFFFRARLRHRAACRQGSSAG